jgi:hypothetical protein
MLIFFLLFKSAMKCLFQDVNNFEWLELDFFSFNNFQKVVIPVYELTIYVLPKVKTKPKQNQRFTLHESQETFAYIIKPPRVCSMEKY